MMTEWRWIVEYRPDRRRADSLMAWRSEELAQAECDELNRDFSETGRDYVVVKYRRIARSARADKRGEGET